MFIFMRTFKSRKRMCNFSTALQVTGRVESGAGYWVNENTQGLLSPFAHKGHQWSIRGDLEVRLPCIFSILHIVSWEHEWTSSCET